ncbi:MAG TPA: metallophosphoesterase [Pseudolabrys sp.]|nr:metallophosphoesterase [Pseudolabrys sp.]
MTFDARSDLQVPPPASRLSRRGLLKAGLTLTGTAGILMPGAAAYAAMEAANGLSITEYALTPPGWSARQRLSIAVIADIHAGGPNMGVARVTQVVDAANALQCDLIVVLGDYFATHPFVTEVVPPKAWAAELARLRAPLGVFAILGNHDWWYGIAATRAALTSVGLPPMENAAVLLGPRGGGFWLAGLGDQLAYRLGGNHFRGVDDLPGTLARVTTDDPVILLAHEPDIFPAVPARVSLTLAGHTHGGQIRLPFVPPVWTPSQYGARYAYGHIVEGGRHMIVSGGLGTSKVPLRLGVPPEIVRVTLG